MGYGVDPEVQIPTILGKSGLPVFLRGKVADVVTNNYGTSIPMVDLSLIHIFHTFIQQMIFIRLLFYNSPSKTIGTSINS